MSVESDVAPVTEPGPAKAARHAWEREREHHYRCTRCGCIKINVLRPGRTPDDRPQWVATFTRNGQYREGATPPCPGQWPPVAPSVAAPADPATVPERWANSGGCAFCRWIDARWRCTHRAYPLPTPFLDAREPDQPCGPNHRLWERRDGGV